MLLFLGIKIKIIILLNELYKKFKNLLLIVWHVKLNMQNFFYLISKYQEQIEQVIFEKCIQIVLLIY